MTEILPPVEGLNSTPLLSLNRITRNYGLPGETPAVRDATFDVHAGEFIAIVGPSGSGKSTLLNILGLLDRPTSGEYLVKGIDSARQSERERDQMRSKTFGFIFQNSHLLPDEPSYLNAALGLRVQGRSLKDQKRISVSVLQKYGLLHRAHTAGRLLSGGERQRLAIARAVAGNPEIILADEPTGNLDSINTQKVVDELRVLADQGVAVIMITHDLSIAAMADRQIRISDGHVFDLHPSIEPGKTVVQSLKAKQRPLGNRHILSSVIGAIADPLNSLTAKPFRTLLLLLAFLLGSGGLVAASGFTATAAQQVTDRLDQAALDELRVIDKRIEAGSLPSTQEISDTQGKLSALQGVKSVGLNSIVAPADAQISHIETGLRGPGSLYNGLVEVSDEKYLEMLDSTFEGIQNLQHMAFDSTVPAAVVGAQIGEDLGIQSAGPGSVIWVRNNPVAIVAVLAHSPRDSSASAKVYLNAAASREIRNLQPQYVVRTNLGFPAPLKDAAPLALSPSAAGLIDVVTVADLRNLRTGVQSDLGSLVGTVSVVLLILACMTAATAMYLSVQARINEIALRRALGASKGAVGRLFLIEGIIVGAAGGLAGSVIGLLVILVVSHLQGWTPIISSFMPVYGVVSGCITGALAASYPAFSASRTDPAIALRA